MYAISRVTERISQIQNRLQAGASDQGASFSNTLQTELSTGLTKPGSRSETGLLGGSSFLGAWSTVDALSARTSGGVLGGPPTPGLSVGTAAAIVRAPGDYGPLRPPGALVGYGNGNIPREALAPIGIANHRLWGPAAASFRSMVVAARREGVEIGVTDSYRSLQGQEAVAAKKGLYAEGGLAATPGTSNHGWGVALDLDLDPQAQQWMRSNGARYGFVEDVPREPWHWTFRPAGS